MAVGAKLRESTSTIRLKVAYTLSRFVKNPNALTLSSIAFAVAFIFAHISNLRITAWILLLIAFLIDTVDGSVARVLRKTSKWGNYLDAMVDKYVEALIYVGLGTTNPFPALVAVSGSLIESYAKPRTALVVPIDNHDWPAIGERVERCAILAVGYGVYALFNLPNTYLSYTLWIVAIITWIGSVQRMLYARRIIEAQKEAKQQNQQR